MTATATRPRGKGRRNRPVAHAVEAAIAYGLFHLIRLAPLDAASAAGGRVLRAVGPRLGAHKQARRRLARAMPELSSAEQERILRGVWDNLGRVVVEYAQMDRLNRRLKDDWRAGGDRLVVEGAEHVLEFRRAGRPVILATGHCGNWEVAPIAAPLYGERLAAMYRPPNNPHIDRLILKARASLGTRLIAKRMGGPGSKQALSALREDGLLGLFLDQHFTGGIETTFFGLPAMTSPVAARFAEHTDAAVVPARVIRTGGVRFRLVMEPALEIPRTGDRDEDAAAITQALTDRVEAWVREYPDQWLWLHNRWKDRRWKDRRRPRSTDAGEADRDATTDRAEADRAAG